jgi:uncharacterized membrane protein
MTTTLHFYHYFEQCVFPFSFYKFHRRTLPNNVKDFPGISIIKPLTCMDPNLYENLKTFFNLNYPRVCKNIIIIIL